MATSSDPAEVNASVKKFCAFFRQAKNDTERVAALVAIGSALKHKNDVCLREVFDEIGFDFINRLIYTSFSPTTEEVLVYRSVAVKLLACYSSVPEMVQHEEMVNKIPIFLEMIFSLIADTNFQSVHTVTDCLLCLRNIAEHPKVGSSILQQDCLPQLCKFVAMSEDNLNVQDLVLGVIFTIVQLDPDIWDTNPANDGAFHVVASALTKRMQRLNDQDKFTTCDTLYSLFLSRKPLADAALTESWCTDLLCELECILRWRLVDAQRYPTLRLAAMLLDHLGPGLTYTGHSQIFLPLLIRLACIEVRVHLEDPPPNSPFDISSSTQNVLSACFSILEMAMRLMIEFDMGLNFHDRQLLYENITPAMSAVLSYIDCVSKHIKNNVEEAETSVTEEVTKAAPDDAYILNSLSEGNQNFLFAVVRVCSVWLAEETSELREEVYQVLPFLLQLGKECLEQRAMSGRKRRSRSRSLLLAAECRKESVGDKEPPPDCMRFLMPGFCHLTVEDKPRHLLLDCNFLTVLLNYLNHMWGVFKQNEMDSDECIKRRVSLADSPDEGSAEISLVTNISVLLNITVMESSLVIRERTFSDILRFVIRALPCIDKQVRHLVLRGNIAVLGLLLLRHLGPKMKAASEAVTYRFLSASVRFLWDAFSVEDSRDFRSLVISHDYAAPWDQLRELWFLGMTTLSTVLEAMPWVARFILDSGWASQIVRSLGRCRNGAVDVAVKTAYEDLLCRLVRTDANAGRQLQEQGALHVCNIHNLKELGDTLSR